MKYDLRKIMKRAWEFVKKLNFLISEALKKSWKEEKGMDVKELVEKYALTIFREDKIRIGNVAEMKKDGAEETIKAKKPEIMAYLRGIEEAKRRAAEERKAKIAAIEGLAEIQNALYEHEEYRRRYERERERGEGFVNLKRPASNIGELKEKYPRATAYLLAQEESLKSNYALAGFGSEALEKIINGEDYEAVIAEMKQKQHEYCMGHIWD